MILREGTAIGPEKSKHFAASGSGTGVAVSQ